MDTVTKNTVINIRHQVRIHIQYFPNNNQVFAFKKCNIVNLNNIINISRQSVPVIDVSLYKNV